MSVSAGGRIYASDLNQLLAKPLVRLVASGTQALADNTPVVITFSTEDIDTHGFHSTSVNTGRITPNIAGFYRFWGTVFFEAQSTPVVSNAFIRLNGATSLAPAGRMAPGTQAFGLACTVMQEMNGTTDYVELIGQQDSAGADNTNQSIQFSSVFECEFIRPS